MTGSDPLGQADRAQQPRAGQEALIGQPDCRLQSGGPAQAAELLMGLPEQGHGSGDADRIKPGGGLPPGQGLSAGAEQIAGPAAAGCDLTAIQHLKCLSPRIPVEKEAAAGEPGTLRFHHRQHGLRADQGIGCRAAFGENIQGRGTGQGIGGDDHRRAGGGGDASAAGVGGFRVIAADRCSSSTG
ncbi:MAG: Uncharacterised protein [Cyanobium sp. ARS6]|nr:MAG: Uncharacterised protein [Cyanobium sp. ARS6]